MDNSGIRNVIQQMLDVESQAQTMVTEAEQKGRDLLAKAREQARTMLDSMRHEATQQAREESARVIAEAQKQREERIARDSAVDAKKLDQSRPKVPQAVQVVLREVIGR